MTDTTMGGGRGGVGIRLFTTGGEVVRRTFDQVGDSGRKMWAEIAMGEKAANPALRAMSRASNEAQAGVQGLAGRAGPAGNVLGAFGATGLTAAAAMGGLAVALGKARESMQFAAELTDTSDRIGIGVEALQAWRFIADEAGVSTEALESNMEKLNASVGAFKSGIGDARLKPVFEALGITQDQLALVQSADDMLLLLAGTLGQVKDRTVQVRFAKALGVEESLPIIRMGTQRLTELSDEAERLGLVVGGDVVGALDAADRKMELAQQRIDTSLRLSVADLAEDFADVVSAIASVISWLTRLDRAMSSFGGGDGSKTPSRGIVGWIDDTARGRTGAEGDAHRDQQLRNTPGWARWLGIGQARVRHLERQDRRVAELAAGMSDLANGTGEYSSSPGWERPVRAARGGGRRDSSDREARERERVLESLARESDRAEQRAVRERHAGDTADERLRLAQENLRLEREQRDAQRQTLKAELERTGALDEATTATFASLEALDREADALEERAAIEEHRRDLAKDALRDRQAREQDALDLLDVEAQLAGTYRERLQIERRILLLSQAAERRALEHEADADGVRTQAETDRLTSLRFRQGRELELFDHNAREEMREQFRSYGHEIVDAVESGRIGEHIGDELKARLIDMALNGLFDFLNPGQKGGGGSNLISQGLSFLGGFFGLGPGRAGGGDLYRGLRHPVVETGRPELLLLGGKGHVTSAAETMRLLQEMSGAGGFGERKGGASDFGRVELEIMPTKEFDVRIRRVASGEARKAGVQAFGQSVRTSLDATPTMLADRRAYRE